MSGYLIPAVHTSVQLVGVPIFYVVVTVTTVTFFCVAIGDFGVSCVSGKTCFDKSMNDAYAVMG